MPTFSDLIESITRVRPTGASPEIGGASVDSRQIQPGQLFVALPGETVDGHDFIANAFENGAVAALVQREVTGFQTIDLRSSSLPNGFELPVAPVCFLVKDGIQALQNFATLWRNQCPTRVIGITGSIGKSTTKEVTAQVLSQRYRTLKNAGNLNNEIGLPLTLIGLTPEHERAVLEMGFFVPGEIQQLCDIAHPSVGVITNIGTVHAERAGSQEIIALGKSELVQALPADGWAILNHDDPWVKPMAQKTSANVLFYGLTSSADLWADEISSHGLEGIRFCMHYHNEAMHLRIPLIGRHSVHTALRAIAVALVEGMTWQEIVTGLQDSKPQLRMVTAHTPAGALVLDDTYNAAPESMLAALNLLDELDGVKIGILGDMLELGPYEQEGHFKVGLRAAEICSELILVGERSRMIGEAAVQAGLNANKITWFASVPELIEYVRGRSFGDGEVVLIKGSHGLRMERVTAAMEAHK